MKRVLLLDDSELVRSAVAIVLGANDCEVIGAESPAELATELDRDVPDLVLLDLTRPGLQGEAIVAVVREKVPESCPIFLFSDRPDAELAIKATACGASGYIKKGGDPTLLVRHVKRLLAV